MDTNTFYGQKGHDQSVRAIPSDGEDSEGDNSQEEWIPESCLRNSKVKGQSVSVSRVTLTCVFVCLFGKHISG